MFARLRSALRDFVQRVTTIELDEKNLAPLLDELFLKLVENDVAVVVAEQLIEELKSKLLGRRAPRDAEAVRRVVLEALREVLLSSFPDPASADILALAKKKRGAGEPLVVLFLGPNGHGKTTTIAKLAYMLTKEGFRVVLACSDTFRAGAMEQLMEHARRLGVKAIRHDYGADPAAVAYDAVASARAHHYDVVLIDTAGRMQTDRNLMDELRKIARVVQPDLKVFVGDALTGNDAVEQALEFDRQVGIDAVILTKLDADAKGGAAISIARTVRKPIIYVGVGQRYEDLLKFDPKWFVDRLLGEL